MHVRPTIWYISLPSPAAKQQRVKWPNSRFSGEREPAHNGEFIILFLNLSGITTNLVPG